MKVAIIIIATGAILGFGYLRMMEGEPVGGQVTATKTRVELITTKSAPTYEFEFKNNITGEIVVKQVSQAEYETWLQGTMNIPNYPVPTMEGYTWIKGSGGKVREIINEPVLKTGEYMVIQEATATTSALYKTASGITTSI